MGGSGGHPPGRLGRYPMGRHPPWAVTPTTATAADGTHPTGMHSCIIIISSQGYYEKDWGPYDYLWWDIYLSWQRISFNPSQRLRSWCSSVSIWVVQDKHKIYQCLNVVEFFGIQWPIVKNHKLIVVIMRSMIPYRRGRQPSKGNANIQFCQIKKLGRWGGRTPGPPPLRFATGMHTNSVLLWKIRLLLIRNARKLVEGSSLIFGMFYFG